MHNPHYGMLFICVDFISEDVVDSVTKWGHTYLLDDWVIESFVLVYTSVKDFATSNFLYGIRVLTVLVTLRLRYI